jgi:hypothetical protein
MLTFKLVTRKHHTWKNYESQSLTNQILKDEIEKTKKKLNYTKGYETKIRN